MEDPMGGLRRRAVSEAHAFDRELELELELKDLESKKLPLDSKSKTKPTFNDFLTVLVVFHAYGNYQ
ncbi:hypothetical protein SC206_16285 [Rouxiella sp. T17]|uniref:hypothetical protein n=1 Tax=Rouxiella sp. T17 TaxID=3085684 RepID=UPI002FC8EB65